MSTAGHLSLVPDVRSAQGSPAAVTSVIPDMPTKLNSKEKKVWTHVTQALLEYGLVHRTDSLMISIICRTYVDWVEASEELDRFKQGNGGSYIVESKNGYCAPHALYYVARDHKRSLLQWLPEAALTIPSFQKIKGPQTDDGQGKLFDVSVSFE